MKYFFLALTIILSILVLRINIKLHSGELSHADKKSDIILQLNFLETELKNNKLGAQMQALFPEGFVFVNALYGLSWCELAIADSSKNSTLKEKAISEALFAYNEIDSDRGRSTFNEHMVPEYGIFYNAWKNYLLSKILRVDTSLNAKYKTTFVKQCNSIADAMSDSDNPFLESYDYQSWPADMFVAVASLSTHDKIFQPRYKPKINTWIAKVKKRLDPETLMIPHKVDTENGKSIQGARGVSMSLMLRMLSEIDHDFAKEQYNLFKSSFISTALGLPSVREYTKDKFGLGDIDSGPVILGVGFAATIVAIGTLPVCGDKESGERQYLTVHAFGFDHISGDQKKYLFGKLPMADAFIAWGRATDLSYAYGNQKQDSDNWRFKFHLISFFFLMAIWILYYRKRLIRKIRMLLTKNKRALS